MTMAFKKTGITQTIGTIKQDEPKPLKSPKSDNKEAQIKQHLQQNKNTTNGIR